ncbi:MAG TPA: hypothetical protein VMW10_03695 [Alphaproteobacteria bacterium]|nr:hypothetical protein [Alphaproteobacteria bacterium]
MFNFEIPEKKNKIYRVDLDDNMPIEELLQEMFQAVGKEVQLSEIRAILHESGDTWFEYVDMESDAEYAARLRKYREDLDNRIKEMGNDQ